MYLCANTNAVHLLSTLDYEKMINHEFNKELIEYVMNHVRLLHLCKTYDISFENLLEFY